VAVTRLDRSAGDSVTGDRNIDLKSYLTSLNWRTTQTGEHVGDTKHFRELLQGIIKTHPNKDTAGPQPLVFRE